MNKGGRRSSRRVKRGGSNMYNLTPEDATGLQTSGASNYAGFSGYSTNSTVSAPMQAGGRSRSRARGQMKAKARSQMKAKARGRSRGIGGYWGAVLEQAIVPLTLLGVQQTYGRKRHLKQRTFKRR